MNKILLVSGLILMAGFIALSCCRKKEKKVIQPEIIPQIDNVEWSKNAVIYEVNIRQYTPEGTFAAFQQHLPRLKKMGIDIIWIMPIHPIGEKERKGTLGSYYSVKDYKAVNPEFGTLADFKKLVDEAHKSGMYVILDWVANHSALDCDLFNTHPEWYKKDSLGNFVSPFDWTDVVQLDYDNKDLHTYMIGAMKYWVTEANIDGYRCDVAGMVPIDFWEKARIELDKIKPVFMLAENEDKPEFLVKAFDMNYAWELHHIMNKIAQNKASADTLRKYFKKETKKIDKKAYRMQFITNHDENSWNGTINERMKKASETMAVISFTVPGMPLIYNGQEAGMNKRLRFFDKDTIDWSDLSLSTFYSKLIEIKTDNIALWNGGFGGDFELINTSNSKKIFAYLRAKDQNKILVLLNLSAKSQSFVIKSKDVFGDYTDALSNSQFTISKKQNIKLPPWGYKILEKN